MSRIDFATAAVALGGVLLLGILQGILLAALASVLMMLTRASRPHVAFLGKVPGSAVLGDMLRHPENIPIPGALVFRPERSLLYINAERVLGLVLSRVAAARAGAIRIVVCDLSASPHMDLAGVQRLRKLHAVLATQNIRLAVIGPHGEVRYLMRRDGFAELVAGIERGVTLDAILATIRPEVA